MGDISGAVAGAIVGGLLIETGPLAIVAAGGADYLVSRIATDIYDHYNGGPPQDE